MGSEADALTLCVETLKDGYVEAFDQFFTLSHPPEPEEADVAPPPADDAPKVSCANIGASCLMRQSASTREWRGV